jgi:hypothetical protein
MGEVAAKRFRLLLIGADRRFHFIALAAKRRQDLRVSHADILAQDAEIL